MKLTLSAGRRGHDLFCRAFPTRKFSGEFAFVHYEHRITHRKQFIHLGRNEQNGSTFLCQIVNDPIDL